MYRSIKVYASDSSSPIFTSILGFAVAAFASLSASSFPLMPIWLGSHTKSTFLGYLLTRPITCSSRLGLQLLFPDAIACSEHESLNVLTFLSELLITHWRANFMAHSSAANIVILSVSLTLCSMLSSGIQKAADVLLSTVLDASVNM